MLLIITDGSSCESAANHAAIAGNLILWESLIPQLVTDQTYK